LVEPIVNETSRKQIENLGKDMKIKTPVKMMDSMVRGTRLALAEVLLGVRLFKNKKTSIIHLSCFSRLLCCCTLALGFLACGLNLCKAELKSKVFTHEKHEKVSFDVPYGFARGHVPTNISDFRAISIETISVDNDQSVEIKTVKSNTKMPDEWPESPIGGNKGILEISGTGSGSVYAVKNGFSFIVQKGDVLRGPCTIFISFAPSFKSKISWDTIVSKQKANVNYSQSQLMITYDLKTVDSASVSKNILVMPKESGVNELVLESSEDLITWEKDVPGDKNTDAANRFYRLRAVKK
jgi:hypothetical protein